VKGVLAGPATRIEHGPDEGACGGCQSRYGQLRPADVPGREPVLLLLTFTRSCHHRRGGAWSGLAFAKAGITEATADPRGGHIATPPVG
jgi:hypothetical protein